LRTSGGEALESAATSNTGKYYPDDFYVEENNSNKERISIFGTVRRLREQRWNLVKTADQYKYIYSFVGEWLKANFKPLQNNTVIS
jgi:protein tyrosine phosphatase